MSARPKDPAADGAPTASASEPSPQLAAVAAAWRQELLEKSGVKDLEHFLGRPNAEGLRLPGLASAPENPVRRGELHPGTPGSFPFTRGNPLAADELAFPDLLCIGRLEEGSALATDLAEGAGGLYLRLDRAERAGVLPPPPVALAELAASRPPARLAFEAGGLPDANLAYAAALHQSGLQLHEAWLGHDPAAALVLDGESRAASPELAQALPQLLQAAQAQPFPVRVLAASGHAAHAAGAGLVTQLGVILSGALQHLRDLEVQGVAPEASAAQLGFGLELSGDLLSDVAALRALRTLWARIQSRCGWEAVPTPIHAVSAWRSLTRRDPWGNLLRGTHQAMAAALGGADQLTLRPFDAALGLPSDLGRRLARNTALILRHESALGRSRDPLGGSHALEALTQDAIAKAYTRFQTLEGAGGLREAIATGLLAEQLSEERAIRQGRIATRKAPITGVTEFANADALLVRAADSAAADPAPSSFPRVRDAAAFEALCDRADALAATGTRPKVLLVLLGSRARHAARQGFAAQLFAAGGLEVVASEPLPLEGLADAQLSLGDGLLATCLCGHDEDYEACAEDLGRLLSKIETPGGHHLAGRAPQGLPLQATLSLGGDALAILDALLTRAEEVQP